MTIIKQNIVPTLIILAASALIILASLPLAQTNWAEGFRTGGEGSEQVVEAEGSEREAADLGVFIYIAPLIKVTLLMSIGGLLTGLILWIVKLVQSNLRGENL